MAEGSCWIWMEKALGVGELFRGVVFLHGAQDMRKPLVKTVI